MLVEGAHKARRGARLKARGDLSDWEPLWRKEAHLELRAQASMHLTTKRGASLHLAGTSTRNSKAS